MASIIRNRQRRIYQIQWHDGRRWVRSKVGTLPAGAKDFPKKDAPEILGALLKFQKSEDAASSSRDHSTPASLDEFLAAHRAFYEVARRPASLKALDHSIRVFHDFCKSSKIRSVGDVTPSLCDRFVTERRKGHAIATVRREVAILAGAWGRAVRNRAITDNPWTTVKVEGQANRRRSSWTPEEFARLTEACRPWLRDLMKLGVNTGLRVRALISLKWENVGWSTATDTGFGFITVPPELDKAKTGYSVPMSAACHDLLARLWADTDAEFVLAGDFGNPIRSIQGVGSAIHRACARAGLKKPDSPCHAMRRTFGRWAVLGTLTGRPVPLYVVSKWMGHHSVKQTEDYLDLSDVASQEWMVGRGG
jgi:integrase